MITITTECPQCAGQKLTKQPNIIDKLRQTIIQQINGVKQFGTDNSALIIMAYQNVLRWIHEMEGDV